MPGICNAPFYRNAMKLEERSLKFSLTSASGGMFQKEMEVNGQLLSVSCLGNAQLNQVPNNVSRGRHIHCDHETPDKALRVLQVLVFFLRIFFTVFTLVGSPRNKK